MSCQWCSAAPCGVCGACHHCAGALPAKDLECCGAVRKSLPVTLTRVAGCPVCKQPARSYFLKDGGVAMSCPGTAEVPKGHRRVEIPGPEVAEEMRAGVEGALRLGKRLRDRWKIASAQ